ncbi:MAG: hypothetical protein R3E32_07580 [Chitinophagales bacterium]
MEEKKIPKEEREVTPPEKGDVEPTPNEDDVEPTPNEDDVEPTPNEDDVEPTPNEDDVEPTPNEDDVEPTPNEDKELSNPYKKIFYFLLIFIICFLISQTIGDSSFINPYNLSKPKLRIHTIEDIINENIIPIENSYLITYWKNAYNYSKKHQWDSVQYFLQKSNKHIESDDRESHKQKFLYSIHNELIGKILSDNLLVDSLFNFLQNGEVLGKKDTSKTISDSSIINTSKTIEENPPIKNEPHNELILTPSWELFSDSMTQLLNDSIKYFNTKHLPNRATIKVYTKENNSLIIDVNYEKEIYYNNFYHKDKSPYQVLSIIKNIIIAIENDFNSELSLIKINAFTNENFKENNWEYNGEIGVINYIEYYHNGIRKEMAISTNTKIDDLKNKFLSIYKIKKILNVYFKDKNIDYELSINTKKPKKHNEINIIFELKIRT